jgi:DNA-binding MarR family transcriptional regulator
MTNASPRKTHAAGDALEPESSYALDDQPGFLLRVALRTHTTVFTANMIDNLTAPQFSTLAKLKEVGPCSQNYLGRLIHYDSATITGVINRLKNRGLIESIVDPLDRRRVAIDLTDSGRAIADEAIAAVRKISKETFSPLSPGEHATLTALLKKVILR